MDQSHKNIPIGDTGVWREETEAGGEREWRVWMVLCGGEWFQRGVSLLSLLTVAWNDSAWRSRVSAG